MKNYFKMSKLPISRLFLALFFLLSSRFLTAQCGSERIDVNATYSVSESSSFVLQIAGGFDDRPYNSQRFRFNVTLQRVPGPLVTSFKIDFGNGQSQTLTFAQADLPITRSFDVDYTSLTNNLVRVSTLPGTASLTQTLKLSSFRAIASPIYRTPTRSDLITGASFSPTCQGFLPTAKDGQAGTASIYVHTLLSPSNATGHVRRPLIFLEGIDFGTAPSRCDPNLSGPDRTVGVGDFGWDNFITGIFEDPNDLDNETFGQINPLVQRMLNDGYDIVFCDFADGADWIQRNGLAFIEVVNFVNREKRAGTTGTCFPNLIVGASMGGQVAKWALRTMENQGINHDAALYVSFDSPQQGANIALSVQSFIWFNANFGGAESRASILPKWNNLNRPAAQQLIVHHFNKIEQTNGCDLRQLFAAEMVQIGGYPSKTRNIATANGSGFGVGQGYASSALLGNFQGSGRIYVARGGFTINPSIQAADIKLSASGASSIANVTKFSDWGVGFEILKGWSLDIFHFGLSVVPVPNSNQISVVVTQTKQNRYLNPVWGTNTTNTVLNSKTLTFNHNYRNWDNAPGGNRQDIARTLKKAVETSLMGQNFEDLPNDVPAGAINGQTFIPSISALDIQTGVDNVNLDIFTAIGANPLSPNVSVTPFAAVFFPKQNQTPKNENHVNISQELGDFIISQMQAAQVTLQSPLAEPYNYGLIRTVIPSVTVASGGILGINNNGRTAYVNRPTSEAPTTKPIFTATATSACDANIVVQSGGQVQLGAGWSNAGVLRIGNRSIVTMQGGSTLQANNASQTIIERGGTLQLQGNSTLQLNNTAQVIVESGGRLIINSGARINLVGSESTILVRNGGQLVIEGNMIFSGNGFFQFDAGHIFTLGNDLLLRGSGRATRLIRLNTPAPLTTNTLTINGRAVTLSDGLIEYGARCQISITNGINQMNAIDNMTFQGSITGTALNFANVANVSIQNCLFNNLNEGIVINSNINLLNFVNIGDSRFNDNRLGLRIRVSQPVNVATRGIFIHDCRFDYVNSGSIEPATACRFENLFNTGVIFARTEFTGVTNGAQWDDLTAIDLRSTSMSLSDGRIMGFKTGISAEKEGFNNINLVRTRLENCQTGANIIGDVVNWNRYGNFEMRCSKLINNQTGVRGQNVQFNIDQGLNDFQNSTVAANSLLFDVCYAPTENLTGISNLTNIQATNNFWAGGFANMRFNLNVKNIPQGVCTGTRRRIEQCAERGRAFTICPQELLSCCNRSPISSDGNNGIITGVPIQCLMGSNNSTANVSPIKVDKRAVIKEAESEESTTKQFSIYPNPANETVKLDIEVGNYTLKVLNTVGQTIFEQNTEGSLSVDISTWTNGIYLFELTDKATNKRQRSKIIVQH